MLISFNRVFTCFVSTFFTIILLLFFTIAFLLFFLLFYYFTFLLLLLLLLLFLYFMVCLRTVDLNFFFIEIALLFCFSLHSTLRHFFVSCFSLASSYPSAFYSFRFIPRTKRHLRQFLSILDAFCSRDRALRFSASRLDDNSHTNNDDKLQLMHRERPSAGKSPDAESCRALRPIPSPTFDAPTLTAFTDTSIKIFGNHTNVLEVGETWENS